MFAKTDIINQSLNFIFDSDYTTDKINQISRSRDSILEKKRFHVSETIFFEEREMKNFNFKHFEN